MSSLKRWFAVCCCWALCAACDEQTADVRVNVRVVDDVGAPIARGQVLLDGVAAGVTATDGSLWLSWGAERRGRVELTLRCPDGFEAPAPRRLRARHEGVRRLDLVCASTTRSLLLAIDAKGGEGLPVRIDGEQVGEVPASGLFHAQFERPVGTSPRVSIDTRSRPELQPQNPLATVRLDGDEIVVLSPEFHARRKRRRSRRTPVAKDPVPRRLRSL